MLGLTVMLSFQGYFKVSFLSYLNAEHDHDGFARDSNGLLSVAALNFHGSHCPFIFGY